VSLLLLLGVVPFPLLPFSVVSDERTGDDWKTCFWRVDENIQCLAMLGSPGVLARARASQSHITNKYIVILNYITLYNNRILINVAVIDRCDSNCPTRNDATGEGFSHPAVAVSDLLATPYWSRGL
jgi:hypothetical protein